MGYFVCSNFTFEKIGLKLFIPAALSCARIITYLRIVDVNFEKLRVKVLGKTITYHIILP